MTSARMICVVADDRSVHEYLTGLLSPFPCEVRCFESTDAFDSEVNLDQPCCLLLDLQVHGRSAFEYLDRLRSRRVDVPVIFVTAGSDVATAVKAIKLGAIDFLTRPVRAAELFAAIQVALAKSQERVEARLEQTLVRERLARLTPREQEVLALVLVGKRNKEIACALASQEATVKVHRSRLMRKLELRTLAELLSFGRDLDVVPRIPDRPRFAQRRRVAPIATQTAGAVTR